MTNCSTLLHCCTAALLLDLVWCRLCLYNPTAKTDCLASAADMASRSKVSVTSTTYNYQFKAGFHGKFEVSLGEGAGVSDTDGLV